MNFIYRIRQDIETYTPGSIALSEEKETIYSPDKRFYFDATPIQMNVPNANWTTLLIEIFDELSKERIGRFIRNDDRYFYHWLESSNSYYLFLSEDYMGESLFDLNNKILYSYTVDHNKEEGFIWFDFIPSPDKSKIAIIGCYWGSELGVIVYDLAKLPQLPLPRLNEFISLDDAKIKWINNTELGFYNRELKTERTIRF